MPITSRISFPDEGEMSNDQERVRAAIASGPRGGVRGPLRLLLHTPNIAQHVQSLGAALRWESCLSKPVTEMVILLVARHLGADYVWHFHTAIVERESLLASEIVTAIADGYEPALSQQDEVLAYRFTKTLLDRRLVSDDLLLEVGEAFGDRGVVELMCLVGYYHIGGYIASVANLKPEDVASNDIVNRQHK